MGNSASGSVDAPGLRAEIVTTGTEILLGDIVDTNAAWMAQQLREAGINLYYKSTVGDNLGRVREVLELGLRRSDVILVSGGLGPTADDITRDAIAAATGRTLKLHEAALETLKARFARFGVQMTENNLQQVMIPEDATLIENPVGTAPGFIVETDRGTIIALPGVPREMKHLMTETVLPYLRQRAGHTGIIRRRILRTVGIGESAIDDRLRDLMDSANPTVGLAAHTAQCDVRIAARGSSAAEAERLLDEIEATIRARIGEFVYSATPDEPFEALIARLLAERGATLALVETNTGGSVAQRLGTAATHAPVVAAWRAEDAELPAPVRAALPAGDEVIDEAHAAATATALRQAAGADVALALLGSGGADEGVYGRSNGRTWLALAATDGVQTALCPFGGRDDYTVVRIGNQALGLLWAWLRR
ncbi:MAG: CinA family nicotinamide mononucleotide deamidase-related protein [Caldilineaceae bacterium]|nr:CinA family nicotinamide mononucleotide deamidase-related protein [Caldilineaceae bacterium]